MPFVLSIALSDKRLRGHDHIWTIVGSLGRDGAPFTRQDVEAQTNAHTDVVHDYINRLTRAGYLAEAGWRGEGHWREKLFTLVRWTRQTPSLRRDGTPGRYGRARQQIWNVLRGSSARRGILVTDVLMLGTTEDVALTRIATVEYLRFLAAAGYLVVSSMPKTRAQRYRLRPEMNTGPLAPKLLKSRAVFDPNRRELVASIIEGEDE